MLFILKLMQVYTLMISICVNTSEMALAVVSVQPLDRVRIDFDNLVDTSYLLLDMGVALLLPWCILVMEKVIIFKYTI